MRRIGLNLPRVGIAALVLALAVPAWGMSMRPVNLPEMVQQADRIVVARAVDEWTGRDERGIPATVTTFEVSRSLKGGPLARIQIKQFGVTEVQPDGLATFVEGMPRYQKGSEYLLFFKPDSVFGFTSPVGAFQGAFLVRTAEQGKKAVLNGVNNANLLHGLGDEQKIRLGLLPENFPFVSRERGPVYLDEVTGMVERLLKSGKAVSR
jgi:hypothetical protein